MSKRLCLHYIVAVDFGLMMQPTSAAVLEQETYDVPDHGVENRAMRLRHLERFPLDAKYPAIIERVDRLLTRVKELDQAGGPDLLVDITATGRAIIDLMKGEGLEPLAVTISNGIGETKHDQRDYRVSKLALVGNLQVLYSTEKLKVSKALELVPTLVEELQAFKMRPPPVNANDPEAWREGQHDDLVFATALAAWWASNNLPRPQSVRDRDQRAIDRHAERWQSTIV